MRFLLCFYPGLITYGALKVVGFWPSWLVLSIIMMITSGVKDSCFPVCQCHINATMPGQVMILKVLNLLIGSSALWSPNWDTMVVAHSSPPTSSQPQNDKSKALEGRSSHWRPRAAHICEHSGWLATVCLPHVEALGNAWAKGNCPPKQRPDGSQQIMKLTSWGSGRQDLYTTTLVHFAGELLFSKANNAL